MEEQVIRVYTKKLVKENTKRTITNSPTKYSRVLVFDTETTADEYQNMLFGFFTVYENNIYQYKGLIYDPRHITSEDLETLEKYAEDYAFESREIYEKLFSPNIIPNYAFARLASELPENAKIISQYAIGSGDDKSTVTILKKENELKYKEESDLLKVLPVSDVIYMTRIQKERMETYYEDIATAIIHMYLTIHEYKDSPEKISNKLKISKEKLGKYIRIPQVSINVSTKL